MFKVVRVLGHVSHEESWREQGRLAWEENVQGDLIGAYRCREGSNKIVGSSPR